VRNRTGRGTAVPEEILLVLGMGCGMNRHDDEWLIEQWRRWRGPLTRYWRDHFGSEPFAATVARAEEWPE
jgi:hypothetical protein